MIDELQLRKQVVEAEEKRLAMPRSKTIKKTQAKTKVSLDSHSEKVLFDYVCGVESCGKRFPFRRDLVRHLNRSNTLEHLKARTEHLKARQK